MWVVEERDKGLDDVAGKVEVAVCDKQLPKAPYSHTPQVLQHYDSYEVKERPISKN